MRSEPTNELRADLDPTDRYDKLYSCVRLDTRLDMKAKLAYTFIAGLARKSGKCFLSNKRLSEELSMGITATKGALSTLAHVGLITMRYESNTSGTVRVIQIPRLADVYPPDSSDVSDSGGGSECDRPRTDSGRPLSECDRPLSDSGHIRDVLTDDVTDTPPTPPRGESAPDFSLAENDGAPVQNTFRRTPRDTRERAHPYWQAPGRQEHFNRWMTAYPRKDDPEGAMRAWRETLGESMTDAATWQIFGAICKVRWAEWKAQARAVSKVPTAENWLRKREWEHAAFVPLANPHESAPVMSGYRSQADINSAAPGKFVH